MRSKPATVTVVILFCLLSVFSVPPAFSSTLVSDEKGGRGTDTGSIVSKVDIEFTEHPRDVGKLEEMARNLIFFRQGEHFLPPRLQESIDVLKSTKTFHVAAAEVHQDGDNVILRFRLTPMRLIKDIVINGAFPLFERKILNVMTVYIGDTYIPGDLSKQESVIAELFKREGYIDPQVKIVADLPSEEEYVILHVNITKGAYYRLENLEFYGNRVISAGKLKLKMKTWRATLRPWSSGRFVETRLRQDITRLTNYYRQEGYADVVIDHSVEKHPDVSNVNVTVTISEGPRYEVSFSGNREFRNAVLRKDLVLLQEGNKYDLGIKKSIKKMRERYRKAGYGATTISIEEEKETAERNNKRAIRFVVDEGPCTYIESIIISGNEHFDVEKIEKQMLTRLPTMTDKGAFVPETLEEDILAIKSLYAKHGYAAAKVKKELVWSDDRKRVKIRILITEGVQTLVVSVKVTGVTVIENDEAVRALLLKEGEPFKKYLVKSDENTLSQIITEKGYPHVRVRGRTALSEDGKSAEIEYRALEGPYMEMGSVFYRGNFRTKEKILQNELRMRTGDPFSLVKMLHGQRNLRNMDIFNSVRFKTVGLKEKRDAVDFLVEVEEKKPFFFELGGGYESQRGLFAQTKLGDHNMFGTNKYGWVGGEISQIGYRADLGLSEPRLFGTRTSGNLGIYTETLEEFNQDFGTRTYGTSLGFSRKWSRSVATGLNIGYEQKKKYLRDAVQSSGAFVSEDELNTRSIIVATPSVTYDTRDFFVRPRKGMYTLLSVDISKGLRNSLDDFCKYRFDARFYVTPVRRVTFALLGRAGYINTYGSAGQIPEDQIFFLGGIGDVRGFDENLLRYDDEGKPVGGRTSIAGSMEARIDLGRNFELTTFYDTGSISNSYNDSGSSSFRSSAGLGLRYLTPIGPIGILYGHKMDRREDESAGRFHFSIGYTF